MVGFKVDLAGYTVFVGSVGDHLRGACQLELRWVVTDMASFRLVGGCSDQCSCGLNCQTHTGLA